MRGFVSLLAIAAAGCAGAEQRLQPPSLAPRPAEAIDPRVPVPEAAVQTQASAVLLEQLNALVAQALAGDQTFRSAAATAERLADSAGPPQSESWVVAQQALSVAVAARAPVAVALGEIDALGATRIQQAGGIGAADLAAIEAAASRVAGIDAEQAAMIERLQARLDG